MPVPHAPGWMSGYVSTPPDANAGTKDESARAEALRAAMVAELRGWG